MASELQSAERTLRVLEVLAEHPGARLSELAKAAGLPMATAHRIARMLGDRGYIQRDGPGGAYRLTAKMVQVGGMGYAQPGLLDMARPALTQLRDATGETADLAVLCEGRAVIVATAQASDRFRVCSALGASEHLHCSAIGKALAAVQDPPIVPQQLKAFTPNTITKKSLLLKEFEHIRDSRLAFDREECAIGVWCIAAPVSGRNGKCVAAIGISGPSSRLAARERAAAKAVAAAAEQVTAALQGA